MCTSDLIVPGRQPALQSRTGPVQGQYRARAGFSLCSFSTQGWVCSERSIRIEQSNQETNSESIRMQKYVVANYTGLCLDISPKHVHEKTLSIHKYPYLETLNPLCSTLT